MGKPSNADVWRFICDDATSLWTWTRVSPLGEQIAASLYTFASLNVCIADAKRAGFVKSTGKLRRIRGSEITNPDRDPELQIYAQERRRRERKP